jgi:hypothetical protein
MNAGAIADLDDASPQGVPWVLPSVDSNHDRALDR